MKVFVGIIDTRTGIYQTGMIDEPIQKGFEIANAVGHFGININEIEWENRSDLHSFGKVRETMKVVSVITLKNISPKDISPQNIYE